eukprot:182833-Rhodomonas_salina.1
MGLFTAQKHVLPVWDDPSHHGDIESDRRPGALVTGSSDGLVHKTCESLTRQLSTRQSPS